ncbi:wall-associated receptor kinase 5-like [Magnolia sinica]|uniref:wall-associated receptor kinase 5-like n=1 Tax=Magnolia sinica TaxID=86752 RepID=UPI002657F620|nr:wall-associated receptor kinase 5-like [Magnolia sinica]
MPGCPDKCGHVEIYYPFGVGDGCFLPGFEVICNQSIPFIAQSNLSILEISEGVRISSTPLTAENYTPALKLIYSSLIKLPKNGPYSFCFNSNKFIVIGCDAWGLIAQNISLATSCSSVCISKESVINGSCNGHGCCQASLPLVNGSLDPKELPLIDKSFDIYVNHVKQNLTNYPLHSYGFVAEDGSYDFNELDLGHFNRNISMKLEWAIGEGNCLQAVESNSCLCGENSYCIESKRGYGYLCKCHEGYQGNPYLNSTHGCQDVNECNTGSNLTDACKNRVPGYDCLSPCMTAEHPLEQRHEGHKLTAPLAIVAISIFLLLWAPCFALLYRIRKKRNITNIKDKHFQQNGGILLQDYSISSRGTSRKHTKIFSAGELRKATDNYDSKRIIGSSCQGTVYLGTLEDGSIIAVKKLYAVAKNHVDQFIDEIVVLTQINHKNIAELLGCCLETRVPFLVYEFILGKTLYQKLHGDADNSTPLSWKSRLQIATEIAEALSYLHSCASMPIVHRDVKSSNIILDENHKAKLVNFGVSRFIPYDKTWVLMVMKGTRVYLDPEYFETGKLTERSNVYSFGVVLVELLTGQTAIQHEKTQEYNILVTDFLSCVEKGDLLKILDERLLGEGETDDFQATMEITRRCLSSKGEKRPTMKEVLRELALMVRWKYQVTKM